MKSYALLALAAGARLASAHSTVYAIWVNDVDQGLGNSAAGYIRSPPNNDPIKDVKSASMTCNVNNVATAKTIEVKGGDKITFEWHHNDRSDSDDIIASSHKGPIMTYIAPTKSNGAGDVWVKLAEEGYDASTSKWAVDNLIANKGKHSITLPDLAAGEYLLRPEIIALHEADRLDMAQLYMECVQIKVTSSGAKSLPAGVAIPGTYSDTDAGIHFNLYGDASSFAGYTFPGPAVWDGASGAAAPVASSAAAVSSKAAVTSAVAAATSAKPVVTVAPVVSSAKPVVTAAPVVTSAAAVVTAAPVVKTTLVTLVRSSSKAAIPSAAPATGVTALAYGQCGGTGFTGASACPSGWTCKVQNPYYSQCL